MKVRNYLSIIVFACLVGGYVSQYVLGSQRNEVKQATEHFHINVISVKDFTYLKQNISQLLVSADLIFASNETYLIQGAISQANLLIAQIDRLRKSKSLFENNEKLLLAKDNILSIKHYLNKASQQIFSGQLNNSILYLKNYDDASADLVLELEEVSNKVNTQLEEELIRLNDLNEKSKKLDVITTLSFLLLILFLWYWANKQISRPLALLSEMVKKTKNTYTFNGVEKGPIEVLKLSSQFKILTELLIFQANHDALTNLVNRREFERQLDYTILNFENGESHILCYIDLDRFKIVNDTGGHAAGDALLTRIANLLSEKIRGSDLVARMGGDEFTMLLKNCELNSAVESCNRLLESIEEIRFKWEDEIFTISASIGLSVLTGDEKNSHDAINVADEACTLAKESGRNQIIILDKTDKRIGKKRNETRHANKIMNAIDESQFKLYYQNIIPVGTNVFDKKYYEILTRMEIDNGEIISPASFLPIIDRYNLHTKLDRWVVTEAIETHLKESVNLSEIELCSINLSGPSLSSKSFRNYLISLIKSTNFPGNKLCFEITETATILNIDSAIEFISELKKYDVLFALDDFGTGHSSFEYLKKLPVDYIKIDGSFVKDMIENPADMATVKSITEVGLATGKIIVAEFVHSKEIADALTDMGIKYAQGYYYHEPEALIFDDNQYLNKASND